MNYIDADKLIAEIERRIESWDIRGKNSPAGQGKDTCESRVTELSDLLSFIASLQQEQPETDMKSPFTGGKVAILSREEEVTFRGEKVKITCKYYRCEDTGREFTDSKLDDDMMWAVFRAYCEKKGMTSFTDIMLKQEQPSLPSNLDEAAEDMLDDAAYDWVMDNYGNPKESLFDFDCRCFKAGAEWMAGQGVKFDTKMSWLDSFGFQIGWPEDTSIFDCFNEGDKVVVQIRKK